MVEYKVVVLVQMSQLEKRLNEYASAYWRAIKIEYRGNFCDIVFEREYNEEARKMLNEKIETV